MCEMLDPVENFIPWRTEKIFARNLEKFYMKAKRPN